MFAHAISNEGAEALVNRENIKINHKSTFKACNTILDSKSNQITRYPISIFRQIKKLKDEEQKIELDRFLNELRNALPTGYKIGAAIRGGDCFFDSIAQGLNELKKKSVITRNKNFNVKLLREDCASYASEYKERLINDANGQSYFVPHISSHLGADEEKTFDRYLESITKPAKEVECPIWGRPEIEGKMICKKYGVKVKIIELRDYEMDGLHVAKSKVGKGNNIIYLGNYESHFVPLLSDIEEDVKKRIKVSREEAYDNAVDSNSNIISQSYISKPLQAVDNFSHKQSEHAKSSDKKNHETSRKRGRELSVGNMDDNNIPKKARLNVNTTCNDDSIFASNLFRQNELDNIGQIKQYIPHHLIALMYRLDLSILCSVRKTIYKHKYPSLKLVFKDSEIDEFSDIVFHFEKKSIHIQIENVDNHYISNEISYAKLFNKGKQSFSVNNHFNSFVKHLISKLDSSPNDIEYLIIYTNSCLDLTEEKKLKRSRFKSFYPFKFDSIDMEKCEILKDFLYTNKIIQGRDFYQFSKDETTREEILKQLKLSAAMTKLIKDEGLSQEFEKETKNSFLDKLVFAVNQPDREELNRIVKNEIEKSIEVRKDYIKLQERILRKLKGHKKSEILYEFNILMLSLHDMFLNDNLFSINFGDKSYVSNDIIINYKNRVTYLKVLKVDNDIGYNQLFPSSQQNNTISIDNLFALFEKLGENVRYLIIYTNSSLVKKLKPKYSNDLNILKFHSVNIEKKRYKVLKHCSFIDRNGLCQFAREGSEREKLLSLLKLPPCLQKRKENGGLSDESERGIKENFLNRLIFAVNQPNSKELNKFIKNEIEESNRSNKIPYNYEELYEIALRWSESHKFGPITKGIMENLLKDIKNSRSSYLDVQNENVDEISKFVKVMIGREGIPAFNQFLDFLIAGEGRKYLKVLKRKGIKLTNISSILNRAGLMAPKAFMDLYDLWFDEKGNRTQYLKTLEKEGICLNSMSNILSGAKTSASETFKNLYDLWFDKLGNKTQYLKTLEKEGINLATVSSILGRAGFNASKAFKDLYDLWFDDGGNKTQYLKTLDKERINLSSISNILNGMGVNGPKVFKELYNLWFDEQGNKTQYLKNLEKEGISLSNMSNILSGALTNAPQAFKDLHDLWFNENGDKTQYLKTLEKERIKLATLSNILNRAGANAAKSFKELYDLWFDKEGNKTEFLKTLEKEEINLTNVSSILGGGGANAPKAFKDLYDLWFDKQGNKTLYLRSLEKEKINLATVSTILHKARANAAKNFKDLYDLWFDEEGNKTVYLITLEKERMNLSSICNILGGTGANGAKAFKSLYDLWFDKQRNKTQYLKILEKEGACLPSVSSILYGTGANNAKVFKNLYDLWFDKQGNKSQFLKTLEKEGVNLSNVIGILSKAGAKAAKAFKDLYYQWFDKQGNKTKYLKTLEKEEINLINVSSFLEGAGAKGAKAFKDLYYLWFDKQGNKTQDMRILRKHGINLDSISTILRGAGANSAKAFKDLHNLWFDEKGDKTLYLRTLEEYGINLCNVSSILNGAGTNGAKAFKDLYDLWFDKQGNKTIYLKTLETEGVNLSNVSNTLHALGANGTKIFFKSLYSVWFDEQRKKTQYLKTLEENGINLINMSSVLAGTGSNSAKAFKDLYDLWFDEQRNKKQHLKHFIEEKDGKRSFTMHNLSSILSGVGNNAIDAFEKLHNVCFNDEGKRTKLLDDFYNAGFKPSDLSSILYRGGIYASSILIRLHNVCFDEEGNKTQLLDDFYNIGFTPGYLCRILSAAADSLEKFHNFCFVEETKKYLNHFLNENESFTLRNLCNILHGAEVNACFALKDFHDVCFDEAGCKTQLLNDFYNVGFKSKHLSKILSMTGVNAASVLRNFHKSCFNNENYLNHFLAENEVFKPKFLSKILDATGLDVCPTFEKLHNLCFDKVGNKTNYLINLIETNQPNEIFDVLYTKVRETPNFLGDITLSTGN